MFARCDHLRTVRQWEKVRRETNEMCAKERPMAPGLREPSSWMADQSVVRDDLATFYARFYWRNVMTCLGQTDVNTNSGLSRLTDHRR